MTELFPEQKVAVDFALDRITKGKLCSIEGGAGTGKTKTVTARGSQGLIDRLLALGYQITLVAMTNKAVTNASLMLAQEGLGLQVETKTIHSLLKKNREVIDQKTGKRKFKRGDDDRFDEDYDPKKHVLFVEEMGQVPNIPDNELVLELLSLDNPIVCLGDNCQLPPIGEDIGSLFELCSDQSYKLTEVIRYTGDILQVATEMRNVIKQADALNLIENSNDGTDGLFKLPPNRLKAKAAEFYTSQEFQENPNKFRILTWRKAAMDFWNAWVRQIIYGKQALEERFLPGERIICMESATSKEFIRTRDKSFWKTNKLMSASEEGTIVDVQTFLSDCEHAFNLKYHKLTILSEFGKTVNLRVLFESEQPKLKQVLDTYYKEREWSKFWSVKDYFHDVRHAYALNIDRIQGITLENIMLDIEDIASNRDIWHRNRVGYTCLTRAQKAIYF